MSAVIETERHAVPLMDKLRQRTLTLHGVRIGLSGSPASQSEPTAVDIDVKGVRVASPDGPREEFDVFLGGGTDGSGIASQPYKLGVDLEQLPQLVEDVIREYYLRHSPGQSFRCYWQHRLSAGVETKTP